MEIGAPEPAEQAGGSRMSGLAKFLFPAPAERRTGAIFKWWEKRRLSYNLAITGGGLLTYVYGTVVTLLPPNSTGLDYPPLEGPLTILLVANAVYLLGPATEVLLSRVLGSQGPAAGPALFRGLLTLGVGAALFPSLIMTFIWIARILEWLL